MIMVIVSLVHLQLIKKSMRLINVSTIINRFLKTGRGDSARVTSVGVTGGLEKECKGAII
jgi:hypothetical protein